MTLYRNFSLGGFTTFQTVHDGKNQKMYLGNLRGPNFQKNFLPFPPNLQDIGVRWWFLQKGVIYIYIWPSQHTNHHGFGVVCDFWEPIPHLARQLLGEHRGVAQLAPPGRWYAGTHHGLDELRGTLGGGGAAAAYWRGGLYINGCQCEWHASWWLGLGTSFFFFWHMEFVFFFFGGIFLNGGLVKQQFWLFLVSSLDSSWPFCCCFHAEALQKCHGSWGYFDLNTNLVADLKVHCSE